MDVARVYDLDITAQYFPLKIYTREVDYSDVDVQVGSGKCDTDQVVPNTAPPVVSRTLAVRGLHGIILP